MGKIQEGKDFWGKTVTRGMWVLFNQLKYRNFIFGKVVDIAPKSFVIKCERSWTKDSTEEVRQMFDQVILVDESQVPQKVKDLIQ